VDPRLIEIGARTYASIFKDYCKRSSYEETLGEFAGIRDVFVEAAEAHSSAVLLAVTCGQWNMIGLYNITAIQSYGEPFTCIVGDRIAKLQEVPSPKLVRHG
jgi:hypothetical protein